MTSIYGNLDFDAAYAVANHGFEYADIVDGHTWHGLVYVDRETLDNLGEHEYADAWSVVHGEHTVMVWIRVDGDGFKHVTDSARMDPTGTGDAVKELMARWDRFNATGVL